MEVFVFTIALFTVTVAQTTPLNGRDESSNPTPTRPFTVEAFESPYPSGQGFTGLILTAEGGNFILNATKPRNPTVLFVNGLGRCYLVGDCQHLDLPVNAMSHDY